MYKFCLSTNTDPSFQLTKYLESIRELYLPVEKTQIQILLIDWNIKKGNYKTAYKLIVNSLENALYKCSYNDWIFLVKLLNKLLPDEKKITRLLDPESLLKMRLYLKADAKMPSLLLKLDEDIIEYLLKLMDAIYLVGGLNLSERLLHKIFYVCREIKNIEIKAKCWDKLAIVHLYKGQISLAKDYLIKSIKEIQNNRPDLFMGDILLDYAELKFISKDFNACKKILLLAKNEFEFFQKEIPLKYFFLSACVEVETGKYENVLEISGEIKKIGDGKYLNLANFFIELVNYITIENYDSKKIFEEISQIKGNFDLLLIARALTMAGKYVKGKNGYLLLTEGQEILSDLSFKYELAWNLLEQWKKSKIEALNEE